VSYPTVLAPWYVVQRFRDDGSISGDYLPPEYYRTDEAGEGIWTDKKKDAMLFMSLQAAARVARSTVAEVRVLTTKEELEEFRPKGDA
jgi:hypothetical protein